MATPKKKHLIDLMIEAGVKWPEGAEYAAQDKRFNKVNFYKNGKPNYPIGLDSWMADNCNYMRNDGLVLSSICRNWHQTIVTREQYAEAVAAAAMTPAAQQETQPSPKYCASVMRQMPDNTIEQLTSDYYAKAAEADRLQSVADEALKAADNALLALEKAGELIGLVISIDTKPKHVEQPAEPEQPVITDWRDLRVGDVVWWEGDAKIESGEYTVERVEPADYTGDCTIFLSAKEWVDVSEEEWRFIRRP